LPTLEPQRKHSPRAEVRIRLHRTTRPVESAGHKTDHRRSLCARRHLVASCTLRLLNETWTRTMFHLTTGGPTTALTAISAEAPEPALQTWPRLSRRWTVFR